MGIDVMHVNGEVFERNTKIIADSFKENNTAEWFASACAAAITDDPVLGATFWSYYGAEYGNQTSDINRYLDN